MRINTVRTNTAATPVTVHTSWQFAGAVVSSAGAVVSLDGTVVATANIYTVASSPDYCPSFCSQYTERERVWKQCLIEVIRNYW